MANNIAIICLVALSFSSLAAAYDPSALQDFCVATKDKVRVNGAICKDPKNVDANDFFLSGLHKKRNTNNTFGSNVTAVTVNELPGLNTLGISMNRIDIGPWGVNPFHIHPRASEIITVLEGSVEVGFVTSNPDNRLITKQLKKGDVFVFPLGLVHYNRNKGDCTVVLMSVFSIQNPGVITIGKAVFASKPVIDKDILAKALQMDASVVHQIKDNLQN